MDKHQVNEGKQFQRPNEQIVYTLTTTPYGSSPTSIVVTVFDITSGTPQDVTSTVTSGSVIVAGDVITLPTVGNLTAGKLYRVDIRFTTQQTVWEPYVLIQGVQ